VPSRRDELLTGFLRSTLEQLGSLREMVARSSEAGRARLDLSLLRRERAKLLQAVGEQVATAAAQGAMEVPPEVAEALERVADIDRRIGDQEKQTAARDAEAYHAAASAAGAVAGGARERARAQASAAGAERPPNVSPDLDETDELDDETEQADQPDQPAPAQPAAAAAAPAPARKARKRPSK